MNSEDLTDSKPGVLKSYISSMEEMLNVLEQASLDQARALEFRNIILTTQLETSIDGILIVDEDGLIISHNRRFAEMWGLTSEPIMSRRHVQALQPVLHLLVDPSLFMARLQYLYENKDEKGRDEIALNDGRVFERYTAPMKGIDGNYYGRVWYLRDITERLLADQALRKLSMAVEGASDWVLITDINGNIEYVNSAIERMSGYRKEELLGQKPSIFKSGNHNELFFNELWTTILSGRPFMAIISNRKKNGGLFDVFNTITPLKDSSGIITHFISTAKDMTEQKLLEEKVHHLAYYDELTGLPNRAFHLEVMTRTIEHAKRYGQKIGVLCIDLDNFKRINDSLGLSIGDMLLKTMADRLTIFLRNSDFAARSGQGETVEVLYRMGGDEFLVILQNVEGQDAARVAGRLLRELSRPCILNGRDVFITASIGISLYPDDGEDVDDLLKNADAAMYQAKEQGRNNYQFYSKSLSATVLEALTMENELRRGIDLDQFVLYYQPKLNASTRAICGMEALIRWIHPEKGMIMPGRFIPLAETSDLILPIGEFALRHACRQVRLWQEAGFRPMSVSVNVSGRQFSQTDLIGVVKDALQFGGISPKYLELEITEGTIMRNPDEAIRTLHILKEMGIQVAIDDFGTGYSSLNYLKQLPLDFLKIDQSFVRNLSSNHSDRAIIRAVIAMAHSLNLKVIAEGVETLEQLAFLREHGCDELQGYLFSQPVAAEEFSGLLKMGFL